MTTEIWAVAHPQHPTTYRDTKQAALALVDAWTTERAAAVCWPMTVEESPTADQTYCDFQMHLQCSGYTEDESDPESCMCDCHDLEETA